MYEKTGKQPSEKGIWVKKHTKKVGIPVEAASTEAIVSFNNKNSININF